MKPSSDFFKTPVILLANGMFPSHEIPLEILMSAGTVLCTDGSADSLIKKGFMPHAIIGDLDSSQLARDSFRGLIIPIEEQENTDMAKALEWCTVNGVKEVWILGATEKRDDHALANFFLLTTYSAHLSLKMVTDYFTVASHSGDKTFESFPGQIVFIISPATVLSISSSGLKFSLKEESINPSSRGVSNQALGHSFSISSTEPVWVFQSHPRE